MVMPSLGHLASLPQWIGQRLAIYVAKGLPSRRENDSLNVRVPLGVTHLYPIPPRSVALQVLVETASEYIDDESAWLDLTDPRRSGCGEIGSIKC